MGALSPPARPSRSGQLQNSGGFMSDEKILRDDRCERCTRLLDRRVTSFFSEETICSACHDDERALIARLQLQGIDLATLAGAARVPQDDAEEAERQRRA